MRIGLNLLHALPEIGGVWNFIGYQLSATASIDTANQYVAYVTRRSKELVPVAPSITHALLDIDARCRPLRVLVENTLLQRRAVTDRLDCLHWFANTNGLMRVVPSVVTIYDLQPFSGYHKFRALKRVYLMAMIRRTVRTADMLLAMSQSTAQDLVRVLNADCSKVRVVPAIIGEHFRPASSEDAARFRAQYSLPNRFWLYVARFYPHKNHAQLLRAYSELVLREPTTWPLVLRGDPDDGYAHLGALATELGITDRVIWLPRIGQSDLPLLYSSATALVFPSLYEGGGIPILEAMACGLPILASDIPPVRESAGDAAIRFDPTDASSIADAMAEAQFRPEKRRNLRQLGLMQIRQYRPENVVRRLVSAYHDCCGRTRGATDEPMTQRASVPKDR